MILTIMGIPLVIVSIIAYSTLHNSENFIEMRFLGIGVLSLFLGFSIQGILGMSIVLFDIDKIYHTFYGFFMILLIELVVCLVIIYKAIEFGMKLHPNKDSFELFIYALVIVMAVYHIRLSVDKSVVIISVIILTIVLLFSGITILRVHTKVLAQYIDIANSLKIFTFSCIFYGFAGISTEIPSMRDDVLLTLLTAHIVLFVSCVSLYYELYVKYLMPEYVINEKIK